MKVAIASTGLGHITRGIETWALDTANALHRREIDVTLFAADEAPGAEAPLVKIPCLKRNHPFVKTLTRFAPGWSWRLHLKNSYNIEQLTFWHGLRKQLRQQNFDLLHIQDPLLAACCNRAWQNNKVPTRALLAHGTEEDPGSLFQFPYLQHLAPWHLQQTLNLRGQLAPEVPDERVAHWTALPNFVDTAVYRPAIPDEQASIRRKLGLPEDAWIVGTAAAVKKHHKRIDWLIDEFSRAAAEEPNLHLVIAGSRQKDTDELIAKAQHQAPDRITFLINYPHENMAELYRAWDAFVLTSHFEMMPIALLEAIASGLPVITNQHPVLEWMGGPGGIRLNMRQDGTLTTLLRQQQTIPWPEKTRAARNHAEVMFSETAVISAYLNWYHDILQDEPVI